MSDSGESETSELVEVGDVRWTAALERIPHDTYHLPAYARLSARLQGGRPVAAHVITPGAELFAPLLLRELPQTLRCPDWHDAVCPLGYASPLLRLSRSAADDAARRALDDLISLLREQRIVTAFFRLNPLLELPLDLLTEGGDLSRHGKTVHLDLTASEQEQWRQLRSSHRLDIKSCERAGFRSTMDEWDRLDDFVEIYRATMIRVGADDASRHDRSYFADLRDSLESHVHLCMTDSPEGIPAAAGLFLEASGIVQFHLSGTADPFLKLAPSKLMLDFVRRWASARGNRCLHYGGGVGGGEDPLFKFKAGFSATHSDFYTWRVVMEPELYATLNRRASSLPSAGFFPAYRA